MPALPPDAAFAIDPRLEASGVTLAEWTLCRVQLKDESRFPWLVLVPRIPDAVELFDLPAADQAAIFQETMRAAAALKGLFPAAKINIGALGNIVRQLHIHVIARHEGDAAWPGAPWIPGDARYAAAERDALAARLRAALG